MLLIKTYIIKAILLPPYFIFCTYITGEVYIGIHVLFQIFKHMNSFNPPRL